MDFWTVGLVAVGFGIFIFVTGVIVGILDNKKVNKDIREDKKKVITCRVKNKYKTRRRKRPGVFDFSVVNTDREEYSVSEEIYSQVEEGQFVEIHLAQPSGKLLRILPIKEESEIIAEIN